MWLLKYATTDPGIPEDIIEKGAELFSRGREYNDKSTGIGLTSG